MKRNLQKCKFVAKPAMLLLLIFGLPFTMQAQSKKITGKVFSASTSEVFPGVNIILKGNTNKGTITDNQGMFSIDAVPGDVLVFSFIGFKTKEVKIGSEATLSVPLEDGGTELNELIVTGSSTGPRRARPIKAVMEVATGVIVWTPLDFSTI